jgi:hypothetical protein
MVAKVLGVLVHHSLNYDDTTDPEVVEDVVHSALQVLVYIAERGHSQDVCHAASPAASCALVQLLTNEDDDPNSKLAFILLQSLETGAIHHILLGITNVCAVLGSRETLPTSLVGAVQASLPTQPEPELQGHLSQWWLERALVVINALVFTSDVATQWLARQQCWHCGLGPLVMVMLSNVGPAEILSAALLATNLVLCCPQELQAEASKLEVVPLMSYIFGSIAAYGSDAAAAEEAAEAQIILLQLCSLLVRGHQSNSADFVQNRNSSFERVLELCQTGGPAAEAASGLLLELAECGCEPAAKGGALAQMVGSNACKAALACISARASTTSDVAAARAAQCCLLLEGEGASGVPHQ